MKADWVVGAAGLSLFIIFWLIMYTSYTVRC